MQVSVLLWGREGTGKTTDALRLTEVGPGRVILVNAEAGAKKEALARHGIDTSRIDVWPSEEQGPGWITYEHIEAEVIDPLREMLEADPNAVVGVIIDSFTEVARRVLERVSAEAMEKAMRLGKNRDRWQVDLADHGVAASQMRSLLRRFRDLPCHLVITALERRDVDSDGGGVTYGPAMGPSVATDTMGLVDLVGFAAVELVGGEEFRTATFTPTATRRAKDRYGLLPITMVDPFMDRIVDYVGGTLTRENDPARKRLLDAVNAAASNVPTAEAATPKGKVK